MISRVGQRKVFRKSYAFLVSELSESFSLATVWRNQQVHIGYYTELVGRHP